MKNILECLFKLKANGSSVKTEILAGISTFLTMSYIIFINPAILSKTGMDMNAVFVATCLAAAFGSFLMGMLANYPIALAPGMGLNVYFTYGVVLGTGCSWQVALGAVFISGLIFLLLSILPVREYILNSIPKSLKVAIIAGIGLFLGVIGCKNAGIIATEKTAPLFMLSYLYQPTTLLALLGLMIIIGLEALGVVSAIIISILVVTFASIGLGYNTLTGIFSMPPSIMPTLFQIDIQGALNLGLFTIIFAFLFVDLFDNTGTLIGIAYRAGLIDKSGKLSRAKQALIADSTAAIAGSLLGTSTTTSYLESVVGVKVGGKTGLTAITVSVLFLLAMFLSPLAQSIPAYATAPALIYVAYLMARSFVDVNWRDVTEYIPALITAVTMPFTFSVAEGISFGFISFVIIKMISRRSSDLNPALIILAILFVMKYVFFNH